MSDDQTVTITVDNTTLLILRMVRDSAAEEPVAPAEGMGTVEFSIAAKAYDRWSDLDYAGKLLAAWRSLRLLQEQVDLEQAP